ncbi:hypothetical protein [Streptomyces sp. NPDC059409]|uniref:hypothetical protein n=1 Tax=Streptomyces sp. NPDC059409 TaxID=3346824 RepID=UPI003689A978
MASNEEIDYLLTCGEEVGIRRCTWFSPLPQALEAALTFSLRLLRGHLKASDPQGEPTCPNGRQSGQAATDGRTHDGRNSRIHGGILIRTGEGSSSRLNCPREQEGQR